MNKQQTLEALEAIATERQFIYDQTIARIVIDRALKNGKLDEASLTAEYTRAVGRRDALGWLQRAAQNALDGARSASEADYQTALALFDD